MWFADRTAVELRRATAVYISVVWVRARQRLIVVIIGSTDICYAVARRTLDARLTHAACEIRNKTRTTIPHARSCTCALAAAAHVISFGPPKVCKFVSGFHSFSHVYVSSENLNCFIAAFVVVESFFSSEEWCRVWNQMPMLRFCQTYIFIVPNTGLRLHIYI
jgi:hypothetical protein